MQLLKLCYALVPSSTIGTSRLLPCLVLYNNDYSPVSAAFKISAAIHSFLTSAYTFSSRIDDNSQLKRVTTGKQTVCVCVCVCVHVCMRSMFVKMQI